MMKPILDDRLRLYSRLLDLDAQSASLEVHTFQSCFLVQVTVRAFSFYHNPFRNHPYALSCLGRGDLE